MAEAVEGAAISPPSPPIQASKLPGWATGMALGQVMAEQFVEKNSAWGELAGSFEGGAEAVTAVFQHLMCQVMSTMGKSTDYLEEMDDEDNPAKGLLPT
jgi:hypothetical protein